MDTLEKAIKSFLKISFYITALLPVPHCTLFNVIYRLCWIVWLVFVVYFMFHLGKNESADPDADYIGSLIGISLFVLESLAHLVCILEVMWKSSKWRRIQRLQLEVDHLLSIHFSIDIKESRHHSAHYVLTILILLIITYGSEILRSILNWHATISPVYWYSRPTGYVSSLRSIQIICVVMELNRRMDILKRQLLLLAAYSKPVSRFALGIWRPYADWEYEQVNVLRLMYAHIYEAYETFNDCFGWSILMSLISAFFDFVCNAFWTYMTLKVGFALDKMVFNSASTFFMGCTVFVLFWSMDLSQQNGRTVGGLIANLVKPLGNKRYNDLVTAFSLQVLNQEIILTAKKVFNLNLNLFGGMIAAIVVYLFILIQFSEQD